MEEKLLNVQIELAQIVSILNGLDTMANYKIGQGNYTSLDFQGDCQNICNLTIQKIQGVIEELGAMRRDA